MGERENEIFKARFDARFDELKWLYISLYNNYDMLEDLNHNLYNIYMARGDELRALDLEREKTPNWYKAPGMFGVTMYPKLFAGGLKGVQEHIPYLQELGIRYIHLMPLMKTPYEQNDGGYAVTDFREVDPSIGTVEDLKNLSAALRKAGISLCCDFVMNHTADNHDWAMRAKAGDPEYQARYMMYDNYDIPRIYEWTVPEVFPNTAPGNFTWNEQMHKFVLTSFYPFQWDLNYKNPVVFNEMVYNLLFLANCGAEVLRIDAVPYIWKELGTTCRNLPQVHTIMRMVRLICEIVCPGVLLKGEVVMAPKELPIYFGTHDKPECHLLYNVSTMVNTWGALATADTRLLREMVDTIAALPPQCSFVNYLRCHDDIGWGLDEDAVRRLGFDPLQHKIFLYRFFDGEYEGSYARGALYNYDEKSLDARSCGTTASLCGIEKGEYEGDPKQVETGIHRDLMLHAFMISLSGIPMLSSGDEIGQLNDWSYKDDPSRAADSRNIHRSPFNWDAASHRHDPSTVQGQIFEGLQKMKTLRSQHDAFNTDARVYTMDTGDNGVLCLVREYGGERLYCVYNFTNYVKDLTMPAFTGKEEDLFTGVHAGQGKLLLPEYGYMWLRA